MKKVSKLLAAVFVFLLAGCLTSPADARLSAGPEDYNFDTSGPCGESLTYTIEDRVLKIKGTGDMWDYGKGMNWNPFGFEKIMIESGVTSIGEYVFSYLDGSPITSVQLPDTLKEIGESAFGKCNHLTELVLPEGLTSIGDSAFISCSSLKELSIPRSVTDIGLCVWSPHVRPEDQRMWEDTPSDWAKSEIVEAAFDFLVTQRTCKGYHQDITRIQTAELIANMAETAVEVRRSKVLPEGSIIGWEHFAAAEIPINLEKTFQDTRDYMVFKASSAGIVTGRSEGIFAPNEKSTREEIAVMLCRAADYIKEHSEGYAGLNMSADIPAQYADAEQVSSWAVSSVAALADAGILTGTSPTTLSPKANASVQEVILLTLRLYKQIIS